MRHIQRPLLSALAFASLALAPIGAHAGPQTLKNDTWSPGSYINDGMSGGVAFICFPDETFSAEFEAQQNWFPYQIKKVQVVTVKNPLDELMGGGPSCGRFKVQIWRGTGSAQPGEPIWDSQEKANKIWELKGDSQAHTLDLEADNALPPPIQAGQGRIRVGITAVDKSCASGGGSYPAVAPDGASPKSGFNWGYGWAVMLGCDSGKSGNAFWVTAEQFGIKGNFILRLVIDASDMPPPDDAGPTEDASEPYDAGPTPVDTSPVWDFPPQDTGTKDAGGSLDLGNPWDFSTKDAAGGASDVKPASDGSFGSVGPLKLLAVEPACVGSLATDTLITLKGTGFSSDLVVTIDDVPMPEVLYGGSSSAQVLVKKGSLKNGSFTVKVEAHGQKALLVPPSGLRVGGCGGGGADSGCVVASRPARARAPLLFAALGLAFASLLVARRRTQRREELC